MNWYIINDREAFKDAHNRERKGPSTTSETGGKRKTDQVEHQQQGLQQVS